MFKMSTKSAFRPVKYARVEPNANDPENDNQQDTGLASVKQMSSSPRKVAFRSQPNELPESQSPVLRIKGLQRKVPKPSSSLTFSSRPRSQVVIRYGDCSVVAINRMALQRAVPDLTKLESFHKFRFLVIPAETFADTHHVNVHSMKCFASLCEAMYLRDAPLVDYDAPSLHGALQIARTLRANGIMVLCEHLLRDKHSIRA